MSLDNPKPGPNSTSEYLVSAIPWVTSSLVSGIQRYSFPYVTSFFIVKNVASTTSSSIRCGFTQNGVSDLAGNYVIINQGSTFNTEFRVKELFVSASSPTTVTVCAGLTRISANMFPFLSASNGDQGVG